MNNDDFRYDDLSRAKTQQRLLIKVLEVSPDGTRSPTIHELTRSLGKAADSNISRALDELETKGYIQRDRVDSSAAQARGIWLAQRGFDWLTSQGYDTSRYARMVIINNDVRVIPVLGEIGAGGGVGTDDYAPDGYIPSSDIVDHLPLPAQNLPVGPVYALNVSGESMTGDGILDGDQVLVVPYPNPKGAGEMVVAVVNGDATVKRLVFDGKTAWLHPSNPAYTSMSYTESDSFYIQGRVIGVIRWKIKESLT